MREKLIELLCTCSCHGTGESLGSCPDRKHGMCGEVADLSYCVIQNLASHLIANGVIIKSDCEDCASKTTRIIDKLHGEIAKSRSAQKWIPASEPPTRKDADKYGRVLAMEMGMMALVNYKGPINYPDRFPYWMPLPEPPKD